MNLSNLRSFFPSLVLIMLPLLLMNCSEPAGTRINGTIKNAADMAIYLEQMGVNNNQVTTLLTENINSSGAFDMPLPNGIDAGIYRVRIGSKNIEFISDGTEKNISVNADLMTIQDADYTITGSPSTTAYLNALNGLINKEIDANGLRKIAMEDANPLVGFMIASRLFNYRDDFAEIHSTVLSKLKSQYPDIYFLNDYSNIVSQLEKAKARKDAMAKIKVGMDAPDIALEDPNGKIRKLSDYKGKVVLLDFWASWCRPCRKANPHVVEIYNKYKGNGFDVFSVSLDGIDNRTRSRIGNDPTQIKMNLDRQKERWLAAIKQDNLTWEGHVSDLMKWDSKAAAEYGVSSIPKTFLVGRDGKIAAVDPRYDLEEAVKAAL